MIPDFVNKICDFIDHEMTDAQFFAAIFGVVFVCYLIAELGEGRFD